jgi:hypothetical protein
MGQPFTNGITLELHPRVCTIVHGKTVPENKDQTDKQSLLTGHMTDLDYFSKQSKVNIFFNFIITFFA